MHTAQINTKTHRKSHNFPIKSLQITFKRIHFKDLCNISLVTVDFMVKRKGCMGTAPTGVCNGTENLGLKLGAALAGREGVGGTVA